MALSSFADGSLFGTRFGTAPPRVVALHGWGRSHQDFAASLEGLNAVSVDLPGFGVSPAPSEVGGASMYAKLVAPILDICDTPVILVGHSFGGRLAVHLAEQRPAAIGGLVLTGVPLLHRAYRRGQPALWYRLGRLLHRWGVVNDGFLEGLRDKYGSADYRAASGVMRDILVTVVNESYEQQLRSISAPVDLVWGDGDDAAPPEIAARAEALLADARLTLLGGIDHFVPTTAPFALREAIDRRLSALQ
ncbi:MAG: alpha/beta hydrolase [Acidimicrobiales bacterium]|nr:alpha/beta hydrolase [Acidimicrobiales bacterium]MDP6902001.1 alpha/beta hydrolase [Acidimicrobiales bacterium]